jgi:hypothetical protein
MVLGITAVLALVAAPGTTQAPSQRVFERAVRQLVEERAQLAPRRNLPPRVITEPGTACAIPLLEMPIDKRAIPLLRVPPLKRTAPMPQFRPRVCPKR